MNLENGKIYEINHSRKGTFVMRVDKQDDTWTDGTIIDGETQAMNAYNKAYKGEEITMRTSFIRSATEVKLEDSENG